MLAKADVQARLQELREEARRADLLTMQQKRAFLKRVVQTPISAVTEDDALCARVVRTTRVTGEGTVEKVVIEMPDKLKALELDAKLAGELRGGAGLECREEGSSCATADNVSERLQRVLRDMLRVAGAPVTSLVKPPLEVAPGSSRAERLERIALEVAVSMTGQTPRE